MNTFGLTISLIALQGMFSANSAELDLLPLDVVGSPVTAVTVDKIGTGYKQGQLLTFDHGTTAMVAGGTASQPVLTVTNPGNWGCIHAPSQVGVRAISNTGSGTGATFTLTTPVANAYGVKQLTHCYSGMAGVIQASSGPPAKSLPFVNGVWDEAAADQFCRGVVNLDCRVKTIKDQGGAGADMEQSTPESAPIYNPDVKLSGLRPISFIGSRNGSPRRFTTWLTNAMSVTTTQWDYGNYTAIIVGRVANSREPRTIIQSAGSPGRMWLSGAFSSEFGYGATMTHYSATPCPAGLDDTVSIAGISGSSRGVDCWNGNQIATLNQRPSGVFSGLNLGSSVLSVDGVMTASDMDVLAFIIYPYTLDEKQRTALTNSLSRHFSVELNYDEVVVWSGDSTGDNGSLTNTTMVSQAAALLHGHAAKFINTSVSGATASAISKWVDANECKIYAELAQAGTVHFIFAEMAGPNDIRARKSASEIQDSLRTLVAKVKSCAPRSKFLIGIPMLQYDISRDSAQMATLVALNTWLEANWKIPASQGGLGADCIANFWRDSTVGGHGGTSALGPPPNEYSVDGQHFTDQGQHVMATVLKNALGACEK